MNKNYLKFFKLVLRKNSLLRALQIYECLNIRLHGAPKDYFRFSKQFFELNLKKYGFKKIRVKPLGFRPFIASYSLVYSYLKFIPVLNQLSLLLAYILDTVIQILVRTNLEEIFPLGYFFSAKK